MPMKSEQGREKAMKTRAKWFIVVLGVASALGLLVLLVRLDRQNQAAWEELPLFRGSPSQEAVQNDEPQEEPAEEFTPEDAFFDEDEHTSSGRYWRERFPSVEGYGGLGRVVSQPTGHKGGSR